MIDLLKYILTAHESRLIDGTSGGQSCSQKAETTDSCLRLCFKTYELESVEFLRSMRWAVSGKFRWACGRFRSPGQGSFARDLSRIMSPTSCVGYLRKFGDGKALSVQGLKSMLPTLSVKPPFQQHLPHVKLYWGNEMPTPSELNQKRTGNPEPLTQLCLKLPE